jgi:hypothetical protein
MTDAELINVFRPIIINGLTQSGIMGVVVQQAYQPIQIGVPTGPTVAFFKVGDHAFGSARNNSKWKLLTNEMIRTVEQMYETTFQIEALVPQSPTPEDEMTASDLINTVRAILQDEDAVQTMVSNGIGILRVTEIRNPYFLDDRDQNEASSSFDFILTHTQTITKVVPIIQFTEFDIKRV